MPEEHDADEAASWREILPFARPKLAKNPYEIGLVTGCKSRENIDRHLSTADVRMTGVRYMKFALRRSAVVTAFALAAAVPAFAHHSFSIFSMDKNVTYKGKVVEYKWVNPHSHIIMKVDPGPGVDAETVGTWDIEGGSTNIMGRQGWNKVTFKAGDEITAVAHPLKDGSKGASLFYVIMPDGKRLYHDIARPKGEAS
jgi:hypothetical protein